MQVTVKTTEELFAEYLHAEINGSLTQLVGELARSGAPKEAVLQLIADTFPTHLDEVKP